MKKILIIPDCHHPFVDKDCWNLVVKVGNILKPDVTAILGDFADFFSVSSYSKDPNRINDLEKEVAIVNKALDQVDSFGSSRKIFCSGNHEFRLERYLQDKAPPLFNMMTVPKLFKLKERGYEYVPYREFTKIGKLHVTHEAGSGGMNAHIKAGMAFEGSVVMGHVHGLRVNYRGNVKGESHVAASLGWLGSIEEADYMHKVQAMRDWMHGFGLAYMQPNGIVHLQAVPIINKSCVINGELIKV